MRALPVEQAVSNTDSETLPRGLRFAAWGSLIANIAILGTGGAVRLTGSGLGCPSWPLCTPGSLIPTDELTYHSLIEFGNRLMTGVLGILAILVILLMWSIRRSRADLFRLAWVVLGGVILQGVLGGIIVLLHLDANLVGLHYVISLALVAITATYVARMGEAGGPRTRDVSPAFMIVTHITSAVLFVTVIFGVLTTGSGPHSGDATIQRDGIDAEIMAHVHSWPGYILAGLLALILCWSVARRYAVTPWIAALIALTAVQIIVGIYQAREHLPPLAVGVHMVLAGVVVACAAVVVLKLKRPAASPRDA